MAHGDVTPDNLIFNKFGYLELINSGIISSESPGTIGYVAPELIEGKTQGIVADYFSLGVVAWELVYGTLPYQGSSHF